MDNINKKEFYESATRKILSKIDNMALAPDDRRQAIYFTKLFREAFKFDEIKQYTFITKYNKIWDLGYDSAGFCRAASITFAIVMGLKDWQLMCIDESEWSVHESHHYLKHIPSGEFFDITYDQFAIDGITVPYDFGHKAIFGLTPNDYPIKFARALDIDIIDVLKGKQKGK